MPEKPKSIKMAEFEEQLRDKQAEIRKKTLEEEIKREKQKIWDHFAGHALASVSGNLPPSETAQRAASIADEMMKIRRNR